MQFDNKAINTLGLLDGLKFPVSREQVIVCANDNGATEEATSLIRAIPEKQYHSIEELNIEIAKMRTPNGSDNIFASKQAEFSDDIKNTIEDLQK